MSKMRFHYDTSAQLPDPTTYHGMFAHVHDQAKGYYAHAGAWVALANEAHTHTLAQIADQNCGAGNAIQGWSAGTLTCLSMVGDISAVNTNAGSGLTGGAASGEATLSLLTTCANGQVLKWNTTPEPDAWECAMDLDTNSGGTVTSLTAGTGLTGGTITTTGTIAVDTTTIQNRVSGTCPAGNAIRVINADGTVTCQTLWSLSGNSGTDDSSNFIGTTDSQRVYFKVHNTQIMRLGNDAAGNVSVLIGTGSDPNPFGRLRVYAASNSPSAIFGLTENSNSSGVYGKASNASNLAIGVTGEGGCCDSGIGVYGTGGYIGVKGYTGSSTGTGVQGYADAYTSTTYGVGSG